MAGEPDVRFHPHFPGVPLSKVQLTASYAGPELVCDVSGTRARTGDVLWSNRARDVDILEASIPPTELHSLRRLTDRSGPAVVIRYLPKFPNVPLIQTSVTAQNDRRWVCDVTGRPAVVGDIVWSNREQDTDVLDAAMPPIDVTIRYHQKFPNVPLTKVFLTASDNGKWTCDETGRSALGGDVIWSNRDHDVDILDAAMPTDSLQNFATTTTSTPLGDGATMNLISFGEATGIPIRVISCDIKVLLALSMQRCLVRLHMSICNETAKANVTAKLRFPLPPGSTVCGLSFEKDGQHFPATPVPKKKAQEVVYAEKEKGRDVAVAKEVQGDVFEMEVHPLPYASSRQCVLTYLQPLQGLDLVELPFCFAEPLVVTCACSSFPPLPSGGTWVDSINGRAPQLVAPITIRPNLQSAPVAGDPLASSMPLHARIIAGECFQALHVSCFIPRAEVDDLLSIGGATNQRDDSVSHIAVLWDSSGSALNSNVEAACGLLSALAGTGAQTFSVYTFAMELQELISQSSLELACSALRNVRYDGGTYLQRCVDELESILSESNDPPGCVLLFSDGLDSLKAKPRLTKELPKLKSPIHCIVTGSPADTNLMQAISRSTGGHCCTKWPGDAGEICAQICNSSTAPFVSAVQTDQDDEAFMQIEEDGFKCVPDHRLVRVSWPVEEDGVMVCTRFDNTRTVSEVRVQLQAGAKHAEKVFNLKEIDSASQLPAEFVHLAGLLFCLAAMKQHSLLGHDEQFAKAQIEELSSRYGVASAASDLLLLYESTQFLEHGIPCPPAHPKHEEWRRRKEKIDSSKNGVDTKDVGSVAFTNNDGDAVRFELLDGKLIKLVNGRMKCGEDDNSGIVKRLHWEPLNGWGGIVYDQYRCGGAVPEDALKILFRLATKALVPHNIPETTDDEDAKHVGGSKNAEELRLVLDLSKKLDNYLKDPVSFCGGFCSGARGARGAYGGGDGARLEAQCMSLCEEDGAQYERRALRACAGPSGSFAATAPAAAPAPPPMAATAAMRSVRAGALLGAPPPAGSAPMQNLAGAPRSLGLRRQQSGGVPAAAPAAHEGSNAETQCLGGVVTDLEAYVKGAEAQYIPKLREAARSGTDWEPLYFKLRGENGKSPSFFIFAAQVLRDDGLPTMLAASARVLTNCLELGVQDVQMFRSVGYGLLAAGLPEDAMLVFQRVLEMEASEPQSHLDLALARFYLLTSGRTCDEKVELLAAAKALVAVLRTRWAERFKEVEWPALVLLRGLWSWGDRRGLGDCWLEAQPRTKFPAEIAQGCEQVLRMGQPVGLLVWMAWDTDHTDVDLHVVEPSGNEVYYSNTNSSIGGHISKDFTQGYGPEVYLLQTPVAGSYRVRAKYYASHQASASTGTTSVIIWSFVNLGGEAGTEQADFRSIRLDTNKEMQDVLRIDIEVKPSASESIYRAVFNKL